MNLDIQTILILLIAVCAVIAMVLVVSWHDEPSARSYGWWSAGCLAAIAGLSLLLWRDRITDVLSVDIANVLLLIGGGLGWAGLRSLYGRRVAFWQVAGPIAPWVAGLIAMGPDDQPWERTVWLSIAASAVCVAIAREFWRGGEERLPSSRPLAALLVFNAAFYLVRGGVALVTPMPDSIGRTGLWFAVSLAEALLFLVAVGLFAVALIREKTARRLKLIAMQDPLTRSLNRRGLAEAATPVLRRLARNGGIVSVVLFDIDGFKLLNDRYGHDVGDGVLSDFARSLGALLPPETLLCRLGGEEFAALLPDTDPEAAMEIAERVRSGIASQAFIYRGTRLSITVSAGVASQQGNDIDLTGLLTLADRALYEAKADGRNRVRLSAASGAG
ncbi:GGDEF domain-containing protein [Rhodoligotrophos defluvii]|uniref:GGDEF domain-containing protein n=1 Tax=Rhodoligotrophos defluvii TaxID=2561934 RepID=UPI0010C9A738|nr:GGDEF domain-containing protein [Rhodoligotrophos defluvii]